MSPTKTYRRCGVEDLKPALELLKISEVSLSKKLGYANSAVNTWLKRGSMPEVASLALTAIMGEQGTPESAKTTFCILEITPGLTPRVIASTTHLEEVILLK